MQRAVRSPRLLGEVFVLGSIPFEVAACAGFGVGCCVWFECCQAPPLFVMATGYGWCPASREQRQALVGALTRRAYLEPPLLESGALAVELRASVIPNVQGDGCPCHSGQLRPATAVTAECASLRGIAGLARRGGVEPQRGTWRLTTSSVTRSTQL